MMEGFQSGALGLSVPKRVEMGVGVAVDHAPIPLQALVERTALTWDLTHNMKIVMTEAAQVNA